MSLNPLFQVTCDEEIALRELPFAEYVAIPYEYDVVVSVALTDSDWMLEEIVNIRLGLQTANNEPGFGRDAAL